MNIISVALGVATVTILGMIWYNPRVFGSRWAQGVGLAEEMKAQTKPVSSIIYAGMLIGATLWSLALGWLLLKTNSQTISDSLTLGLIAWLGISMPIIANARWWESRPWSVVGINGAYQLLSTLSIVFIHFFLG